MPRHIGSPQDGNYAIVRATVFLAVFDDRIDVISPGALPNHMTVD